MPSMLDTFFIVTHAFKYTHLILFALYLNACDTMKNVFKIDGTSVNPYLIYIFCDDMMGLTKYFILIAIWTAFSFKCKIAKHLVCKGAK